jgi:hypothetical protein
MGSLAAETREAVRSRPFLRDALRAGVVNYAAAATFLDLAGEKEAVAAALRRHADELPPYRTESRRARVTMRSGVGFADDPADALFSLGGTGVVPGGGSLTAVLATGDVDADAVASALGRLSTAGVTVEAAGVAGGTLLVVVERRDGAKTVREVEEALAAVPVDEPDRSH